MDINLLAFGQIADIIGKSSLKFSRVEDTEELKRALSELFPTLSLIKYSIAVNKSVIQENTKLSNEDTIALLPPFSGG